MAANIVRPIMMAAVALLCATPQSPAAGARCTVATKGDSPVGQACAKGGQAEAKKVMKSLVKEAKDRGGKFQCDDCHKDTDSYELKPNAREDFKKLAATAQSTPAK
jgi:outer membrane protein OmpA-like peptidoglycan-associated protein